MALQEDLEKVGYSGYPYIQVRMSEKQMRRFMKRAYGLFIGSSNISRSAESYCKTMYRKGSVSTEDIARLIRQAESLSNVANRVKAWAKERLMEMEEEHRLLEERIEDLETGHIVASGSQGKLFVFESNFKKITNRKDLSEEEFKQIPSGGFFLWDGKRYDVHITESSVRDRGYLLVTREGSTIPNTMRYRKGITLPVNIRNNNL